MDNGMYSIGEGAGTGNNETASEREMFRRFIIESIIFWSEEFHIDGFRFDLMALHDVYTMNEIRRNIDERLPNGYNILMYGEPWTGFIGHAIDYIHPYTDAAHGGYGRVDRIPADKDHLQWLDHRVAIFNDEVRGGIKGENDVGYRNQISGGGYAAWGTWNNGNGYPQNHICDRYRQAHAGINAMLGDDHRFFQTREPTQVVTYTTSHDNFSLFDQITNLWTTYRDQTPALYHRGTETIIRSYKMSAAMSLTSRGYNMLLAGEELARTKYGNHNTYNAQDVVNQMDWSRSNSFQSIHNWYRGLIRLRRDFDFNDHRNNPIWQNDINGWDSPTGRQNNLWWHYTSGAPRMPHPSLIGSNPIRPDQYQRVLIVTNPRTHGFENVYVNMPNIHGADSWRILADHRGFRLDANGNLATGDARFWPNGQWAGDTPPIVSDAGYGSLRVRVGPLQAVILVVP
jgi:pullulanase/glycogen debranching enzyme